MRSSSAGFFRPGVGQAGGCWGSAAATSRAVPAMFRWHTPPADTSGSSPSLPEPPGAPCQAPCHSGSLVYPDHRCCLHSLLAPGTGVMTCHSSARGSLLTKRTPQTCCASSGARAFNKPCPPRRVGGRSANERVRDAGSPAVTPKPSRSPLQARIFHTLPRMSSLWRIRVCDPACAEYND